MITYKLLLTKLVTPNMSLTLEQISRIAKLARIEVSSDEAVTVQSELNQVFSLIDQLQSVNTQGVEPMNHPMDMVARLREDRVTETNQRDAFQAIAPQTEAGLYLVPKVIE